MKIKEILTVEASKIRQNTIYMYKEGVFWKAYENSAYLFYRFVKPCMVKTTHFKNVNRHVISIGLPDAGLNNLIKTHDMEHRVLHRNTCVLESQRFIFDPEVYEEFRQKHVFNAKTGLQPKAEPVPYVLPEPIATVVAEPQYKTIVIHSPVIQQLKDFDLALHTPMECMIFLNKLKNMLREE